MYLFAAQRVEVDDVVDAVDEFGCEGFLETLLDDVALHLRLLGLAGGGVETHAHAEVLQLAAADVGGHDDDGVAEVDLAADAVGELSVVEHLEQHVEHVGVCLLNLVEQHDAIGFAAYTLGELAALLVAHISRRRSDEAAHGELLHVLAHVDAYHGGLAVEEVFGQNLGQVGLADAGGAEEEEAADGAVGVLEAGAVAADGFGNLGDGLVLTHHAALQLFLHTQQAVALALGDAFHGHAGHHGHYGSHVLVGDGHLALALVSVPLALHVGQLALEVAFLVAQLGGLAVAFAGQHLFLLCSHALHLFLEVDNLLGYLHIGYMYARACLVEGVDGLVGLQTVADVALGEFHAGFQRLVAEDHQVVLLVFFLYIGQYVEGLFRGGGFDEHLLEAALEGGVFLDILAVFVEGCGAYALDDAAGQGGLEHVAGVEASAGAAGTHDGVDFVDEDDDFGMLLQLVDDGLHAFLELAAVFGARHQRGEVEAHQALAVESPRHAAFGDAYGQALGDGALAHAALAYEDGVVLLAAAENLGDAVHLLVAADDGVELAVERQLGQVASEVLEGGSAALAFLGLSLAFLTLAQGVGKGVVDVVVARLTAEVGVAAGFQAAVVAHQLGEALVVDAVAHQHAGHQVVVLLQHGQDEVLGANLGRFQLDALQIAQTQHLLGLPQHGNLAVGGIADVALRLTHLVLQTFAERGGVHAHRRQHGHCRAFGQTGHAEEEVFDAYTAVFQADSLVAAEGHSLPCIFT